MFLGWGFCRRKNTEQRELLTPRQERAALLHERVPAHYKASEGTYGAPIIAADLRDENILVTQKTVAKTMRELGIARISPRMFLVKTTITDHETVFPPDLVNRKFDQGRFSAVWTSDITYLNYQGSVAYRCAIRDEHSGGVVGYTSDDHMRDDLAVEALRMAFFTWACHTRAIVFHTDHGVQGGFNGSSHHYGLKFSLGSIGYSHDSSMIESFLKRMQTKIVQGKTWTAVLGLSTAMVEYSENFHNMGSVHSSLQYMNTG